MAARLTSLGIKTLGADFHAVLSTKPKLYLFSVAPNSLSPSDINFLILLCYRRSMSRRKRKLAASASASSKYSTIDRETAKTAIFLRGANASSRAMSVLKELNQLKKPLSKLLTRKNPVRPFDDEQSIEFLCEKNNTPLFACATHNKKRPHNIVFGRLYDGQMLDMVEFGVVALKTASEFTGPSFAIGSKPCFIFQGSAFEVDIDAMKVKSLFLDFFRGYEVEKVALAGLERVCVCTISPQKVFHMRHYTTSFSKSDSGVPNVSLLETGPSIDFALRRTRYAPESMMKLAMKQPKANKKKRVKNVATSSLDDKVGRIHMEEQDFSKLHLQKGKALRKRKGEAEEEPEEQES